MGHIIYDLATFFKEISTVVTILVSRWLFCNMGHIIYDFAPFFEESSTVVTILVSRWLFCMIGHIIYDLVLFFEKSSRWNNTEYCQHHCMMVLKIMFIEV